MDDRSTISWMIMGGPRYDEHTQAQLDQHRALEEQRIAFKRSRSSGRLARLVASLDRWSSGPARSLTVDSCGTYGCPAA